MDLYLQDHRTIFLTHFLNMNISAGYMKKPKGKNSVPTGKHLEPNTWLIKIGANTPTLKNR